MPRRRLALLLALLPACGCTLLDRAAYNIHYEKTLQTDLADRAAYHRMLAEEAWGEAWVAGDIATSDGPYGEGFVDGFADYLDHGGTGAPPAAPPNQFRFGSALSPEGHEAAARYSKGWIAGAAAARATGLRKFSLVPVLMPDPRPPLPPAAFVPPAALPDAPAGRRPAVLPPPAEAGPAPRELSPVDLEARPARRRLPPDGRPDGFRPEGTGSAKPLPGRADDADAELLTAPPPAVDVAARRRPSRP